MIRIGITSAFGFLTNPNLTTNHNALVYLAQISTFYYFNRPTNLAFHNLTSPLKPPQNIHFLPGLGLKFIPTPHQSTLSSALLSENGELPRLSRQIDLCCFFVDSEHLNPSEPSENYNPQMDLPSDWNPPFSNVPRPLSRHLHHFEHVITSHF
jgi:hypothetical protein